MTCIGDFLITFKADRKSFPARQASSPWAPAEEAGEWRVWLQPADQSWKGYPFRSVSGEGWRIWLLGEIFGLPGTDPQVEDFLREVACGRQQPEKLNGHFLLFAWEEASRQWQVWTDRFGTLHAYYATDGQQAALGTFFPAVAAVASRRQLDWPALTGFFAFGFFPQDKTHFQDVRILRPAERYVLDGQGNLLGGQRYWQWQHMPDRTRSYDDTVAEFAHLFKDVLEEQTRESRIAIPISGGLDSRSTVAAITARDAATPPPMHLWSYSYGYGDNSVETKIARQVAEARGLPFRAWSIQPYLFEHLREILSCVEGFHDLTQCRQASVVQEIASQADYLLAAHWGDVWLDDMGLAGKDPGLTKNQHVLQHTLKKMAKTGDWLLARVARSHLGGEEPEFLLLKMVEEEMKKFDHIADPDFKVKAFKTDQWSHRWTTASLRMFQAAAFPRLPFYDTRLTDFFCTVPSDFVAQRRLQIDYLKRFAPDLARIKWQVYDADLWWYRFFHTWLVPKRAAKKAWRLLTRRQITERNWEVQFLNPQGRQGLERWLCRPGLRLHDLIPLKDLSQLLDDFYQQPVESKLGYTVCQLLTFSVWLEQFG